MGGDCTTCPVCRLTGTCRRTIQECRNRAWQNTREVTTLSLVPPNPFTLRDGWSPYPTGEGKQLRQQTNGFMSCKKEGSLGGGDRLAHSGQGRMVGGSLCSPYPHGDPGLTSFSLSFLRALAYLTDACCAPSIPEALCWSTEGTKISNTHSLLSGGSPFLYREGGC